LHRLPDVVDRFLDRHSRAIVIASLTYLTVVIVAVAVGASWIRDDQITSVRALGSGSRLSVLIVSGNARLLIAAGDDATAFGNALAEALHPTSRRIDIVLLSGENGDRAVVAKARRDFPSATTYMLDGPLSGELANFNLAPEQVIVHQLHVALSGSVDVFVDPVNASDVGWDVQIRSGRSLVEIATDPEALSSIGESASAVVLTSKFDANQLAVPLPDVLIHPGQSTTNASIDDVIERTGVPIWIVRVSDSHSARLTFTEDGVELPENALLIESAPT